MKKPLFIFLITIITTHCYSQISFEKGYYIDNNNEKTICFIKNIDWKNNPTEFEYKVSESTKRKTKTIKTIKEFGVYNYSKYIRSTVKIDRSSGSISSLSNERNPVFKEETLFLKVLIEGFTNLYQYEDGNLVRFFYNTENKVIEQLVFKRYKIGDNLTLYKNEYYKMQLWNHLKCENISYNAIKKVDYNKKDLMKFFIKYNQCKGSNLVDFEKKQKKDLFNLTFRPRININSLSIKNVITSFRNIDFENTTNFGFGIETEFIMTFNKNKWSVIIEPTYQSYSSNITYISMQSLTRIESEALYKSIELPIGIRHYLFINNDNKIFINGSYILDFVSKNSKVNGLNATKSSNFGFGTGYKYKDKFSFELRYHTVRNITSSYQSWYSDYNNLSFIFGYSIF